MRSNRLAGSPLAHRKRLRMEPLEVRWVLSASPLGGLLDTAVRPEPVFLPQDTSITRSGIEFAGWETLTVGERISTVSFEAAPNPTTFELENGGGQTSSLGSFNIVINAGATLAGNQPALDAFNRAAEQWEAFISDSIIVTVDADMANLGNSSVIGSASSLILQAGYTTIRNQLAADADADDGILASLPTSAQFNVNLPAGIGLTGLLTANKSALKAAGFTGLDAQFGVSDASITFNTQFSFDFDNSDGVTPGTIDFETVALHEIGHALGFTSIVDTVDALVDAGSSGNISPRALDLFRFETGSDPSTAGEFTTFSRALDTGGNPIFDDTDDEWRFSTGVATGDGRQASHWKDNGITGVLIGIMDPTLSQGQVTTVAASDLRALDVIGYDILTAANQAPVLDPIGNQNVDEGSQLAFMATATDPDAGDQLTFSLGIGAPAGAAINPTTGAFTWTPDDSSAIPVSIDIIVTDDGTPNLTDTETIQVTVNNVAPTAAIAGTTDIYRGETVTYTLTATDPSPIDQAGLFTFEIDWDGNGTVDETVANVLSGSTVQRTFVSVIANDVQVRATDKDGATGSFGQTPITVSPHVLRDDGGGNIDLIWGGTPGFDAVFVIGSGPALSLFVQFENLVAVNRLDLIGSGVTGRIILHGYDSIDVLVGQFANGNVVEIHGGDGDDVVVGGSLSDELYGDDGDDLILGGTQAIDGDDQLFGGAGRDTLFGNIGADTLDGGAGEDLLVSDQLNFTGSTAFAVIAISDEWMSARPYAERVTNILGITFSGTNGNEILNPGVNILDDGAQDSLIGGLGALDWFFYDFDQDLLGDAIEVDEEETDSDP